MSRVSTSKKINRRLPRSKEGRDNQFGDVGAETRSDGCQNRHTGSESRPKLARWESRVKTLLTRLVVRDVSKSGQLICHQRAWKREQFLSSRRRPDGGHCCAKQTEDRRTNGRRGCSTVKQLGGNASNDVAAAQIRLARFHSALNLHPRKCLM